MSQRNSVTVDVSSGSKCHSVRNVGGRNVKAPFRIGRQYMVRTACHGKWKKVKDNFKLLFYEILNEYFPSSPKRFEQALFKFINSIVKKEKICTCFLICVSYTTDKLSQRVKLQSSSED